MKYCEKNPESLLEENARPSKLLKKNCKSPLKIDLNVIEESEENFTERKRVLLEEEESLGYNSSYKPFVGENNSKEKDNMTLNKEKEKENFPRVEFKRKSTMSTSLSLSEGFNEMNGFSPSKSVVSQSSCSNCSNANLNIPEYKKSNSNSHIFFGRERFNSTPLTIYFEGTDSYLREQYPEKNDYQKTNNYIKKGEFFKDYFPAKEIFKSYNSEVNDDQKLSVESTPKLSVDFCYNMTEPSSRGVDSPHSTIESQTLTNSVECNSTCKTEASSSNNLPKFNNNSLYGKFDFPMYCLGYYSFDCKFITNNLFLNNLFINIFI